MIAGLQKMTLLDYPGKVACTVFLHGCNLRCPFCHNSELFTGKAEPLMSREDFLSFLKTRQGLLDGVCVSGGEPTLYKDLPDFLDEIRRLGFLIKLDTNGCRPQAVKELAEQNLVDYIAMDVKNAPARYPQTVGLERLDLTPIESTLRFLIGGETEYELRTTLVEQLHSEETIRAMGEWLKGLVPGRKPGKLYLQRFVDRDTVLFSGLSAPEPEAVERYAEILADCAEEIFIRN